MWNCLDIIRIAAQIVTILANLTQDQWLTYQTFSITILLSFISLLSYLRVSEHYRYYIDLIVHCIMHVKEFMTIIGVFMAGFTLARFWRFEAHIHTDLHDLETEMPDLSENFTFFVKNSFGDF